VYPQDIQPQNEVVLDISGDENDSLDSESGNDSNSPLFRVKKPKLKKKSGAAERITHTGKQSKYNIWCSELQETPSNSLLRNTHNRSCYITMVT
jgi:hypothetical protein